MMDNIIKPVTLLNRLMPDTMGEALPDILRSQVFAGMTTILEDRLPEIPKLISQGYAALFIMGVNKALLIDVKALEHRSIAEPTSQNVIQGPKDGFTESAETNVSLIRRRIMNERLHIERFEKGNGTRTAVYLSYMEGMVYTGVLEQLRNQLQAIELESLFDSSAIEKKLQPRDQFLMFPAMLSSEKPDTVCSNLLAGRVAVIVDGSPFILVAPAIFADFFESPEDKYQWAVFGVFSRFIRYIAFLFSLCVPSLYVAVISYHQELIPTILLTSIAGQREGIPFPSVIEILIMEITFEILREASTRMPRIVGQSIAIAGALVLGEASVQAGIVSNITVIVVALTVISSYVAPFYTFGANIRLFRYALIAAGSIFGLYGVILGCAFLMIHLSRIQLFGVPYLSSPATLRRRPL
jgi:spore germination protein KA